MIQTANMEMLKNLDVRLTVELGSATLKLRELMGLADGSVVQLDRACADPLDIFANGTLIARGEVVNQNDRFAIRITELLSSEQSESAA